MYFVIAIVAIPVVLFIIGLIASIRVSTSESTISKNDYDKFVDNSIHNEISQNISEKYNKNKEIYDKDFLPKLKTLKNRYLLFYIPGYFYHSKLNRENFFNKMKELAAEVVESYSLEILKSSVFHDEIETAFEFNPIMKNLGMGFIGALNTTDQNRKHENQIATFSINTGFIEKSFKSQGLFSFSQSSNVLLDSNVKMEFKDKKKYNLSIFNSSLTLLIKNDKSTSYKSIFNGIFCVIDKPFFLENAFKFSTKKWPLESYGIKNLKYELSYPGIHKIVNIESKSEDPVEIRKLFQPRFAEDLMTEFKSDSKNLAVYSDPQNKLTIIAISNTMPNKYTDLSLNIESPETFFKDFGIAKGILAKDYYVIKRLGKILKMLEDVNAFSHDYYEDKIIT